MREINYVEINFFFLISYQNIVLLFQKSIQECISVYL